MNPTQKLPKPALAGAIALAGLLSAVAIAQPTKRSIQSPATVFVDQEATADSGRFRAIIGREGFTDANGVTTESNADPAYRSTPLLRLSSGFIFIKGQQSIVETDKTTVHSWGTRYIVWARPADPSKRQPRQDVVFAIENDVCVTPGIDLHLALGAPCDSGTRVPSGSFVVVSYPEGAAPQVGTPATFSSFPDKTTADFFRFATKRAEELDK